MTGISIQDCKFVVNKEKRKIVCIYEGTENFFLRFKEPIHIYSDKQAGGTLPNRFVGIATCAPEDQWDEEFGKRVAFMHLKCAYYKKFFECAKQYVDRVDTQLNHLITELNNYGAHASKSIANDKKYIAKHFE